MSWTENPALARFDYERGEGRSKHRWNVDDAGFHPGRRGPVGKCHRSIDQETAQRLLRSGVVGPSPYEDDEEHPSEVYAVYRGVPYVAVPTVPGKSYRGYPRRGRMSPSIRRVLEERARTEGDGRSFDHWMREYGS